MNKQLTHLLKRAILILTMASALFPPLKAQEGNILKGILSRSELHAWSQMGYTAVWDGPSRSNNFEVRRAIIRVELGISKRWKARLMFNPVLGTLQDTWLDYEILPWMHLRVGQQKIAFGQETALYTPTYDLIEVATQSTRYLSGFGLDPLYGSKAGRDVGVKLYGGFLDQKIKYEIALMNGQGTNTRDLNRHKDLSGRLDVTPWPGVTLHGSFYLGKGHAIGLSNANPDIQIGDDYKRDRISLGVTFDQPYLFVRTGWQKGWDKSVQSTGAYLIARRNLVKDVDAIMAVDYLNRNRRLGMAKTDYWAGIQYWFYKEHRIQAFYVYSHVKGGNCIHNINLQLQFAF